MKNLKIRVASESESKEVQELFFKLGGKWCVGDCKIRNTDEPYLYLEDGLILYGYLGETFSTEQNKETTLQELRDMVNPMKEYLEKQADGSYKLVMRGIVGKDGDIEVPEGENVAYKDHDSGAVYFTSLEMGYRDVDVIWKRHTHPEELPFVDSINDQYAEIEQVRQQTIEATLAERQAQYGCFVGVANTTGALMAVIKNSKNGSTLPYAHEESLHMICSKIARIVNGDYNHKDSWHDIGGYSKLIEDLL